MCIRDRSDKVLFHGGRRRKGEARIVDHAFRQLEGEQNVMSALCRTTETVQPGSVHVVNVKLRSF
eukprot:4197392-Pyramimonas_sp.AAC.1